MKPSREWMFLLLCGVLLNMAVQATSAQNRNSNLLQSNNSNRRRQQQNTSNSRQFLIGQQGKFFLKYFIKYRLLIK